LGALAITLAVITHFANDHSTGFLQSIFGNSYNALELSIWSDTRAGLLPFDRFCNAPTLLGQIINLLFTHLRPTGGRPQAPSEKRHCRNDTPVSQPIQR